MSFSKEQIKKVVEEEKERVTKWLISYNSMNPDISIDHYSKDIDDLCDSILKRFGVKVEIE